MSETGKNVLVRLRREAGISQDKLARLADVTVYYVSRMELGMHCPSIRIVQKLAHGLAQALPDRTPEDIMCELVREWDCGD